jgi:hemerythrin-like domain-containing protein
MAVNHSPANIAQDLLRIHRVISRALIVSARRGEEFLQAGFPDLRLRKGYTDYTRTLTVVLDGHHISEDEIAFPFLKEKIPAAPYDRLTRNHQEIDALIGSVQEALAPVEEDGDEAGLTRLVHGLGNIAEIWRPHIQTEEWYFSPEALAAAASPEEQKQVSAAMAKLSQEHANPASLAVPFVLYNLEPEDRAVMAAALPPQVLDELLPKAWKELWAPMRPFLLE